ncbi:MAG: hypothetical protein RL174_585 [Actinomycetota bacterium]|jgi:hypothetical protein
MSEGAFIVIAIEQMFETKIRTESKFGPKGS